MVEYTPKQLQVLDKHIKRYFGEVDKIIPIENDDIKADILVIKPTKKHKHYVLMTRGLGAHIIKTLVPAIKNEDIGVDIPEHTFDGRIEFVICLPSYWKIDKNEPKWKWPIDCLKDTVEYILAQSQIPELGSILKLHHSNEMKQTIHCEAFVTTILERYNDKATLCQFDENNIVCYFNLLPIYSDEEEYIAQNDGTHLLFLLKDNKIRILPIDTHRKSPASQYLRDYALKFKDMKQILADPQGSLLCMISDSVTYDNAQITYCAHEEPTDSFDSGWHFLSDEDVPDLLNLDSGVYSLNTACNYCPEILHLLNAPVGTILHRKEGKWVVVDDVNIFTA